MRTRLLILSLSTLAFSSCLSLGDGVETVVKESANRGRTKKAILVLRQSGATVSDSYQVSVTDYDTPFDTTQIGNAFIVDAKGVATGLDSTSLHFSWLSDDSLRIEYDEKLRTFAQKTRIDGVTILYKAR